MRYSHQLRPFFVLLDPVEDRSPTPPLSDEQRGRKTYFLAASSNSALRRYIACLPDGERRSSCAATSYFPELKLSQAASEQGSKQSHQSRSLRAFSRLHTLPLALAKDPTPRRRRRDDRALQFYQTGNTTLLLFFFSSSLCVFDQSWHGLRTGSAISSSLSSCCCCCCCMLAVTAA